MGVALTDAPSRRRAGRWARAAMYAAGETATTLCTLGAASAAADAPWGTAALRVTVSFGAASSVVAVIPNGDYARSWRALRT